MKLHFKDIGLSNRLTILNSGKKAVEYFEELLKCITDDSNLNEIPRLQPVTLLLLDINMPIVNGIDVLVRVKDLYRMANQQSGEQLLRQDQEE